MKKKKIVRSAHAARRSSKTTEISPIIAFGVVFIVVAALILWAYVGKIYS